MADLENFIPAIKYGHTGGRLLTNTVVGDVTFDSNGTATFSQGMPFVATITATTTQINAGAVTILTDASVTQNRKVYPTGIVGSLQSAAWTSTVGTPGQGVIAVADGSGGTFFSVGTPALANAGVFGSITGWAGLTAGGIGASGTISFGSPYLRFTGGATSKGLVLDSSGGTFSAGGTIHLTVFGFIK